MNDKSDSNHHHILPLSTYLTIGSILLVLTAVTVWVAVGLDFGAYNLIVAMIIAATKASLVALYFMHLKYDNKLYMVTFVGAILFLAIFIIFIMFDTLRRDDIYDIKSGQINNQALQMNNPAPATSDTTAEATASDTVADSLKAVDTATH